MIIFDRVCVFCIAETRARPRTLLMRLLSGRLPPLWNNQKMLTPSKS